MVQDIAGVPYISEVGQVPGLERGTGHQKTPGSHLSSVKILLLKVNVPMGKFVAILGLKAHLARI